MGKNQTDRSPLLDGFLLVLDVWRSYASPLQHPYFSNAPDVAQRNKRDTAYVISLALSVFSFIIAINADSIWWRTIVCSVSLYRAIDILISLLRIGVSGLYGAVPGTRLARKKIMRNTLAVLINYVELAFWYAALYYIHGSRFPNEYNVSMTAPLSFVLSFTTATTIGYGNIAPQGFVAAALCYAQALTCLLLISFVIGNLIGLAIGSSQLTESSVQLDAGNIVQDGDMAPTDPRFLTASGGVWTAQRLVVLLIIVTLIYLYLLSRNSNGA